MANQIAQTILQQLGGNRFTIMTGAKNLVAGPNYLQFDIGRGAINKANKVRVTLDTNDTYLVEFFYLRGVNCKTCPGAARGIYADRLAPYFTEATGMDTHL
jgi:hypothetical protein